MVKFLKPPCSEEELLEKWLKRGLLVADPEMAKHYIRNIGYYRIKGYSRHFVADPTTHALKAGTSFNDILDVYVFDRKLRLHTLDALERIEVSFKASLSNVVAAHLNDAHWYMNRRNFKRADFHNDFLQMCNQNCSDSSDTFIEHYKTKYNDPVLPPSWMMFEIMTLGNVSKIYSNLDTTLQSLIAQEFNFKRPVIESWLASLTFLRNICAHHNWLWDRNLITRPSFPDHLADIFSLTDVNKYAARALVCAVLMERIAPASTWRSQLVELIINCSQITYTDLGFLEDPSVIFGRLFPDA